VKYFDCRNREKRNGLGCVCDLKSVIDDDRGGMLSNRRAEAPADVTIDATCGIVVSPASQALFEWRIWWLGIIYLGGVRTGAPTTSFVNGSPVAKHAGPRKI
jgi:hypothetical protein